LDFLLDFCGRGLKIQHYWIFDIERVLKIQLFWILELDLVGCSIIHPIQNPETT
jgi:hypothetical protein